MLPAYHSGIWEVELNVGGRELKRCKLRFRKSWLDKNCYKAVTGFQLTSGKALSLSKSFKFGLSIWEPLELVVSKEVTSGVSYGRPHTIYRR